MFFRYIAILLAIFSLNDAICSDNDAQLVNELFGTTNSNKNINENKNSDVRKVEVKKDADAQLVDDLFGTSALNPGSEKKEESKDPDTQLVNELFGGGDSSSDSSSESKESYLSIPMEDRVYVRDDSDGGMGGIFAEIDSANNKYDFKKLDPYERYNKQVLSLNLFLFRNTILPFMFFIDAWVPKPVLKGYRNFNKNLLEPRNYLVHMLRHDKEKMRLTAKRFLINTTFGALGLIDVAGRKYKNYSTTMTFDCTVRKSKPGHYIIVPIVNQYYQREYAVQTTLDYITNPIFFLHFPLNYIAYIIDQSILLLPNKKILYKSRKYDELVYKNLRDVETDLVFNDVNCLG
jgi:ABC-type transporter lipoprotein component MlaA